MFSWFNPIYLVTTYPGLWFLLYATGAGLPIPEEITLVLAGVALYEGQLQLPWLIPVALVGVLMADIQVYCIGRYFGRPILRHRFFQVMLPPAKIEKAEARFHGHSLWAIFTVRFFSGLRGPTYFSAGMLRLPFLRFLAIDFVAACFHVAAYTTIGYVFSPQVEAVIAFIKKADRWVGVTILLALVMLAVYVGYSIGIHRKPK